MLVTGTGTGYLVLATWYWLLDANSQSNPLRAAPNSLIPEEKWCCLYSIFGRSALSQSVKVAGKVAGIPWLSGQGEGVDLHPTEMTWVRYPLPAQEKIFFLFEII